MYGTTTQGYGRSAALGVARGHVGYGAAGAVNAAHANRAVCVHAAEKRNVLQGSWSIPSFMTTAHKPEPRLLVITS